MGTTLTDIQSIIAKLEQEKTGIETAIAALRGLGGQATDVKRGPGRPKATTAKKSADASEGRQRQIEAMRRYWAARRAAAKKQRKA